MAFHAIKHNFEDKNNKGLSLGIEVHQTPSELIRKPGDSAEWFCMHRETDYQVMLWYQQSDGKRPLIGHVNYKTSNVESVFIEDFTLSGDPSGETVMNSSLLVRLYYCAARLARHPTPTTILHKHNSVLFLSAADWNEKLN
ncbi:unnamed protein product [Arctogadus glacialis]